MIKNLEMMENFNSYIWKKTLLNNSMFMSRIQFFEIKSAFMDV